MILYNNTIRKQLKFLFYNKCLKLLTCLVNYEKIGVFSYVSKSYCHQMWLSQA